MSGRFPRARREALFKAQSCVACHTTADGQTPKGPHLADIGKRYKPDESALKPSAKLAQGTRRTGPSRPTTACARASWWASAPMPPSFANPAGCRGS